MPPSLKAVVIGRDQYGNIVPIVVNNTGLVDDTGNPLYSMGAVVEPNSLAQRITARPTDVGAQGAFAFSVLSGTIAAGLAANSPVFAFRWAQTPQLALIKRLAVSMTALGTAFTAGVGRLDLFVARSYSAADTGGTAVNIGAGKQKYRTSFGDSLIGASQIEIANTGTLTAGTRTLDTQALSQIVFGVTTATNAVMLATANLLQRDQGAADWPLVLAQNEGVVIQATVPATGTWQLQVMLDWQEVGTF